MKEGRRKRKTTREVWEVGALCVHVAMFEEQNEGNNNQEVTMKAKDVNKTWAEGSDARIRWTSRLRWRSG